MKTRFSPPVLERERSPLAALRHALSRRIFRSLPPPSAAADGDRPRAATAGRAFSLIEVMIAIGVLFVCIFAILGVVANCLRGARALQRPDMDAGSVAAFFSITNKHEVITEAGTFDDLGDFPQSYNDYSWERICDLYPNSDSTNGLWKEIFIVIHRPSGNPVSTIERLIYDPASTAATMKGGIIR